MTALVVAAALMAGSIGALLRYGITRAFRDAPSRRPWAVLLANLLGCLIAGIVVGASSLDPDGPVRMIALGGFAGGLTTFSAFSVETVQHAIEGRWRTVAGSALGNLVGGFLVFTCAWFVTAASLWMRYG